MFMWTTGGLGYSVAIPSQLNATFNGSAAVTALNKACPAVTAGTLVLGSIMLLRVLTEIAMSLWEGRGGVDNTARGLGVPLLAGENVGVQGEVQGEVQANVVAPLENGMGPMANGGDGAATAGGVMLAALSGAE